mgnify:CR=1 FL=1
MLAHIFNIHPWFLIFWKKAKKILSNNQNHVKLGTFLTLKRSIFNFFQKSFLIWILLSNTLHLTYWKPKSENVIFSTLLVAEKVKALYEFWREKKFFQISFSIVSWNIIYPWWLENSNFFKKGPIVTPLIIINCENKIDI